ncbi:MAG: hypothetical protein ABIK65_00200 [Candidatus Eisenbacteria bacterium]
MVSRKISALPQVLLVVFMATCLTFSFAWADDGDDGTKYNKPPIDVNGDGTEDHGGGDPDNPVPVLGGTGSDHIVDVGVEYMSVYVGASEGTLTKAEFLRLVNIITDVLGTAFAF